MNKRRSGKLLVRAVTVKRLAIITAIFGLAAGLQGGEANLSVKLVSASEDQAGTWGIFEPGMGIDDGNGPAIPNDWKWRATLNLCGPTNIIKAIQIYHTNSNQIWTTQDPAHWPLVVFDNQQQLNKDYATSLGSFASGTHELELYGQIDNRKTYGTHLHVEFTDGSELTVEIPRTQVVYVRPEKRVEAPSVEPQKE